MCGENFGRSARQAARHAYANAASEADVRDERAKHVIVAVKPDVSAS